MQVGDTWLNRRTDRFQELFYMLSSFPASIVVTAGSDRHSFLSLSTYS